MARMKLTEKENLKINNYVQRIEGHRDQRMSSACQFKLSMR